MAAQKKTLKRNLREQNSVASDDVNERRTYRETALSAVLEMERAVLLQPAEEFSSETLDIASLTESASLLWGRLGASKGEVILEHEGTHDVRVDSYPGSVILESVLKMGLLSKRDDYPPPSVPDGPDDQGMAPPRGLLSPCPRARAPSQVGAVADCECYSLRDPHGVSVADVAARLSALADRLWLLLALAAERAVGTAQDTPGQNRAAAGRP
jgi:hypothetical protein